MTALDLETAEIGATQLAQVLGVSRQRVHQLSQAKILTRVGRGRYRLLESISAYVGFLRSEPRGTDGAGGPIDYREQRARLVKLQADHAQIDLDERRGTVIAIADAVAPFGEQCSTIRARFLAMPSRATPRLVAQEHAAIFAILHEEVRSILEELSCDAAMALKAEEAAERDSTTAKEDDGNA